MTGFLVLSYKLMEFLGIKSTGWLPDGLKKSTAREIPSLTNKAAVIAQALRPFPHLDNCPREEEGLSCTAPSCRVSTVSVQLWKKGTRGLALPSGGPRKRPRQPISRTKRLTLLPAHRMAALPIQQDAVAVMGALTTARPFPPF